ncbi:MAG: hypothetical protein EHM84_04135 [Lysobacterales bacterium]|nr:MAG: hypothetical protein EHM84_04135 [Xanthomonadales bacterium]
MKRNQANPPLTARAAIEDLLQAERDSVLAIEAARTEAQALVARATEEAQRLAGRCESRMQRVHERCAFVLEQELQRLQAPDGAAPEAPAAKLVSRAEIELAVMRLAASLTSAGP